MKGFSRVAIYRNHGCKSNNCLTIPLRPSLPTTLTRHCIVKNEDCISGFLEATQSIDFGQCLGCWDCFEILD